MKSYSQKSRTALLVILVFIFSCQEKKIDLTNAINIPPGGNSWVQNNITENDIISKKGIHNWINLENIIHTNFKTTISGELHVGLSAKVEKGTSKVKITVGDKSRVINISNTEYENLEVGVFKIDKPGYQYIKIEGLSKDGETIVDINSVLISGEATNEKVYFTKDDFYFGRRGPSVHLSYETPANKDIIWFYNEITIPKGEDVIGSYFMANGFKDGYFGIQVNSVNERRILFSVWSPFKTQNPKEIPDDYKIILLGKGDNVYSGEFGNEGSGGQSYKVFDWKADVTYKFLLKGKPSVNNSTDYTAYFFDPIENKWNLVASFRRPYTTRHLTRIYSFLENFIPNTGNIRRKGLYKNQWVYTSDNNWHEITKAKFTADATARKESRMDYAGGVEGNLFFMENCGFFSNTTPIDSYFTRTANKKAPEIDFSSLELQK
jgi:hypothetical protein